MSILEKSFKLIWKEFIYGGHLQSLGAASVIFISALLLDLKITWDILLIIYLIFYAPYLYNRFKEIKIDLLTNPERTKYLKSYIHFIPLILIFSILVSLGGLIYFGDAKTIIFGLALLFLGFFYTIFFKNITKKVFLFKNVYVSLFFGILPYFLIVYYSYPLPDYVWILSLFIFLKTILMQISLDIKDIKTDRKEKLITLPVLVGKEKTITYLYLLSLIISVGCPIFFVYLGLFSKLILFLIPVFLFNFYCYYLIKKDQNFGYILQGGEFIIWLFLIIIGKIT